MLRRTPPSVAAICALSMGCAASAQVRVSFYNVAHLQGTAAALQGVLAAMHADDKPGYAIPMDIMVFTEVTQANIANLQSDVNLTAPPGATYSLGTFTTSGSEDSATGANAIFLRNGRVSEIVSGHKDIPTGASRNTDRWEVQLTGYSSPLAKIYIYGSHLKASQGSSNEAARLAGVQAIRADADALPAGTPIIYSGDYNFYTSTETGFQWFLSSGPGQAFDMLGPGDWTGAPNAIKHSQSPRDITRGLTGGGMDDRFDIQLMTATVTDAAGFAFMPGTYRSLGNDGLHYNLAINNGNNFYYPGDLARSNTLADNLFDASDHVPVIVEYQLPAVMHAVLAAQPGKVIRFASVSAELRVSNIAAAVVEAGADELLYGAAGSGSVSGAVSGTAPLEPGYDSKLFPVNTSTVGPISGTITATTSNEAAQNTSIPVSVTGQVVRPSNASFSAVSDVDTLTANFQVPPGSTPVQLTVPVYNLGFDSNQALMDVDAVSMQSGASSISFTSGTGGGFGASPAQLIFTFSPAGLANGVYSRQASVQVSDENIPGASSATLSLTVSVQLGSNHPGDINGDGHVDGADIGLVLSAWGSSGGPSDLNGDGTVDGADLAIVLANWG